MTEWPSIEREAVGRALRLVGLGILAIVVAVSVLYAVPQVVGAEHSYVVLSGSMQPLFGPGDVILVDAVDIEAVQPGDVVTFERGEGAPTTHRVVDTVQTDGGRALVTKGDANEEPDPGLVHQSQLVGRVMNIGGVFLAIPAFGYVVEFANSGQGAVLIVFVPLTLLVLNEIYNRLERHEDPDEPTTPHPEGLGEPTVPPDPVLGGTAPAAEIPTRSNSGSSASSGATADEAVSVGHMDLTLTLLVLAVVVPYSGWMLVRTQTTPSAMVFAGGFVGLALVGYGRARLWLAARKADGSDESDGGGGGGISIRGNGDAGQGAVEIKSGADPASAGDGEAPKVTDGPRPNWPEQAETGAGTDATEGVQ